MGGDKIKEICDRLGEGIWEEQKWPTDFESIVRIYEEESRKIRY